MKIIGALVVVYGLFIGPSNARASVMLNEVGVQDIDFVELYNFGSSAVSIQDYTLEFFSEGTLDFTFTLPDRILQANSGVLEVSDLNVAALNRIYVGGDINWNANIDAAVILRDESGGILDYWTYSPVGNTQIMIAPGVPELSTAAVPLPAIGNLVNTHQRSQSPLTGSEFLKNRWTVGVPSRGSENTGNLKFNPSLATPPPSLIINEVDPNTPDFVEIFNHGCEPVNISGYTVNFWSEFEGLISFPLPSLELGPNTGVLALSDNTIESDPNSIYMGANLNWVRNGGVGVELQDPNGNTVDFMLAVIDEGFSGPPPPLVTLPFPIIKTLSGTDSYQRINRRTSGNTYFAADWGFAPASKGALNSNQLIYPEEACNETVLDFLPAIISGALKQRENKN